MSLILDHINGVADDNRLENLQIVCPNCAATLDTHCGRANRLPVGDRACLRCGADVSAEERPPALLLARLRHALGSGGTADSRRAAGRAAALRAAGRGGGRDELACGRAQVRRQRQRGAQMGAGVRARTGRLGGLTDERGAKSFCR